MYFAQVHVALKENIGQNKRIFKYIYTMDKQIKCF